MEHFESIQAARQLPQKLFFVCHYKRRRSAIRGANVFVFQLSIERFEGDEKQVAVLLADDGTQIDFPKALLPKGVNAGDILTLTIKKDAEATKKVAEQTSAVQTS